MKYFTYLGRHNNPANALQRAAAAVLQAESNLLINDKDAFLASLKNQIEKLNAKHPRCTALTFSTYDHSPSIGLYLGGHFTVDFHLYPVKNGG